MSDRMRVCELKRVRDEWQNERADRVWAEKSEKWVTEWECELTRVRDEWQNECELKIVRDEWQNECELTRVRDEWHNDSVSWQEWEMSDIMRVWADKSERWVTEWESVSWQEWEMSDRMRECELTRVRDECQNERADRESVSWQEWEMSDRMRVWADKSERWVSEWESR